MKYDKEMRGSRQKGGSPPRDRNGRSMPEVPAFVSNPPSARKLVRRSENPPAAKSPKNSKRAGGVPASRPEQREQMIRRNISRHKKRHKKNYILYYILLFLILFATGISLSLTVLFQVEDFQIIGNGTLSAQELEALTGIKKGDNLFRVNVTQAQNNILSKNTSIDRVEVKRSFPSTISIEVQLSEPVAVIRYEGQYYHLSKGGRVVFIEEKNSRDDVPEVIGSDFSDAILGGYIVSGRSNKLDVITAVLESIAANGMQGKIQYIDVTDVTTIKLYYENRIEIRLGGITDIEYELSCVSQLIRDQVLEEEIVSIDATLRNGQYFVRALPSLSLPIEQNTPGYDLAAPQESLPSSEPLQEDASSASMEVSSAASGADSSITDSQGKSSS